MWTRKQWIALCGLSALLFISAAFSLYLDVKTGRTARLFGRERPQVEAARHADEVDRFPTISALAVGPRDDASDQPPRYWISFEEFLQSHPEVQLEAARQRPIVTGELVEGSSIKGKTEIYPQLEGVISGMLGQGSTAQSAIGTVDDKVKNGDEKALPTAEVGSASPPAQASEVLPAAELRRAASAPVGGTASTSVGSPVRSATAPTMLPVDVVSERLLREEWLKFIAKNQAQLMAEWQARKLQEAEEQKQVATQAERSAPPPVVQAPQIEVKPIVLKNEDTGLSARVTFICTVVTCIISLAAFISTLVLSMRQDRRAHEQHVERVIPAAVTSTMPVGRRIAARLQERSRSRRAR